MKFENIAGRLVISWPKNRLAINKSDHDIDCDENGLIIYSSSHPNSKLQPELGKFSYQDVDWSNCNPAPSEPITNDAEAFDFIIKNFMNTEAPAVSTESGTISEGSGSFPDFYELVVTNIGVGPVSVGNFTINQGASPRVFPAVGRHYSGIAFDVPALASLKYEMIKK